MNHVSAPPYPQSAIAGFLLLVAFIAAVGVVDGLVRRDRQAAGACALFGTLALIAAVTIWRAAG